MSDLRTPLPDLEALRVLDLVERAFDGVVVIDADQNIVRADPNAERLTGYGAAELRGAPLDLLLPEGLAELHRRHVREFASSADVSRWVGRGHRRTSLRRRDGVVVPVEITLAKLDEEHMAALMREAGDRVRAEDALLRVTRAERVLSAMNEALDGAGDETEVAERVCGVVVAVAGHAMAWVGFAEDDARCTVRPAARAGVDDGYLDRIDAVWSEEARTPVGVAIRTGRPVVAGPNDEALGPLRGSCLALPILVDGRPVGALSIHAREPGAFDPREADLLSELSRGMGRACTLIRARDDRRRAEARLAEVLDTVGVVAWSARPSDGRVTYMSEAAERLFGRPVEAFVGSAGVWREVVHRDDHAAWHDAFARIEAEGHADLDYRVVRPDGASRWLHASVRGVRGASGALVRRDGIAIDITARREAESARAASEQRFREIAESISDIFWVIDLGTARLTYVSPAYEAVCGRSRDGTLGDSPAAFLGSIHPDDRPRLAAEILRRAAGEAGEIEYRVLRPDGVVRWLRDRSFVVSDAAGRAARIVGVASDVTGQRQMEERLRTSSGLLQSVLDALPFRIAVLDERGVVVMVNAAWSERSERCGIGGAATRGDSFFSTQPAPSAIEAETSERAEAGIRAVLDGQKESFDLEYGCTCDRELTWRALHVAALAFGHAPGRAVIADADVTERRLAAEALTRLNVELERRVAERTAELRRANAALERAGRAKDEFLASMSHELRTPLNAVLGLSELLQEEIHGPVNARQRTTLVRIEESGRHLLALINDILDIAKIEAGKIVIEPGPVLLSDLSRASVRLVQESAQRKRIDVSCEVPAAVPPVLLDERRMKQVLVNLLSNAVKFTPEGGRIGLEASVDEDEDVVRLAVWDTGIGIASGDLSRLFQPFVQLDSSLSRQHAGTGLGLSLVRGLVALSGGTVGVDSTPGAGSRFTVRLPLSWASTRASSLPPSAPRATTSGPPEERARMQVLLAEDDQTNILVVVDFLGSRGYEVRVASNGREAVNMARERCPDIVLMDIQMPVLDGLAATAELRADPSPQLARVPVIALTALAMPGDRERCLAAGADEHLTKPVSLRRLATLIEELIARGALTPPP